MPVSTRSTSTTGAGSKSETIGSPGPEGLSFHLQHDLFHKIKDSGGLTHYINTGGKKKQKLAALLDTIPGFGARGSRQRSQAKRCVRYWYSLRTDAEKSEKLCKRFSISSSPPSKL